MNAKVIRTETDYEAALARIEVLMDANPGTPEEAELELLALLVETYEKEHYPIGMPSAIAAIEFFMDQNGLTNADMVQYFGSPSRVSEILNGKRTLSKAMIRNLVEGLGIPAEILLEVQTSTYTGEYSTATQGYRYTAKAYGVGGCAQASEAVYPPPSYNRYTTEQYSLAA